MSVRTAIGPTGRRLLIAGEFRLRIRPDGSVVVPDLVEPMIPILEALGTDSDAWKSEECIVEVPALEKTRACSTSLTFSQLRQEDSEQLWALHDSLIDSVFAGSIGPRHSGTPEFASLVDLKQELARRLSSPCRVCCIACGAERTEATEGTNGVGICGLGNELSVGAYGMLYNEGPWVGAPGFGVYLGGCGMDCPSCYRPKERRPSSQNSMTTGMLAMLLDQARRAGAKSWHFLGGNPDHSLLRVIETLSLVPHPKPVVWNSALIVGPEALKLLEGLVDIYVPDLKASNRECSRVLCRFESHADVALRNLGALCGRARVVVRYLAAPGHTQCCGDRIRNMIRDQFPDFRFVVVPWSSPSRGAAGTDRGSC